MFVTASTTLIQPAPRPRVRPTSLHSFTVAIRQVWSTAVALCHTGSIGIAPRLRNAKRSCLTPLFLPARPSRFASGCGAFFPGPLPRNRVGMTGQCRLRRRLAALTAQPASHRSRTRRRGLLRFSLPPFGKMLRGPSGSRHRPRQRRAASDHERLPLMASQPSSRPGSTKFHDQAVANAGRFSSARASRHDGKCSFIRATKRGP